MKPLQHPRGWAVAVLLVAPLLLLWPNVLGSHTYVPYDLALFPPVSTTLTAEQLAEVRQGANFDVTEVPVWFAPELELAGQAVREGSLPQWNPYARSGTVLMAHGLDGLLYPPNWLAMAREDPARGLWMLAYVNFAVAGLLMFGFLRALSLGTLAALFGALVFAYSGTAAVNGHFYMRLASLVWLPGLLWAGWRIAETRGLARAPSMIGFAVAMACTWLAGFPPYSAPVTLMAAVWCLYLVLREGRREGGRTGLVVALCLFGAASLGWGLAAAHLLPVLEFFPVSNRLTDPSLAHISGTAFDPMGLLGYLLPDAFGHPSLAASLPYDRSPLALYLGSSSNWETGEPTLPTYNFTEYTVFVGTLTLFLGVIGSLAAENRFRRFAIWSLVGLILLAIAPWPLRYLFLLPGLQTLPPMRFIGLAAVFVGALSAIGLEGLNDLSVRLQRVLLITALSLAALCALLAVLCGAQDPPIYERLDVVGSVAEKYRPVNPDEIDAEFVRNFFRAPDGTDYLEEGRVQLAGNLWRGALALLLAGVWFGLLPLLRRQGGLHLMVLAALLVTGSELLSFGAGLNRGMPLPYSHDTEVHEFLREQRDRYRETGGFTVARAHSVPQLATMLPAGTLGPERIRDLNVYTFLDGRSSAPLRALYQDTFPTFLIRDSLPQAFPDTEALKRPLFDLLGVRYWLSVVPLQFGGTRVGPEISGPGGDFFIYERESVMPRAFMVPRLEVVADDAAVTKALIAPDLDPRAAVLVTPDEADMLGSVSRETPGPGGPGDRSIRFLSDRAAEVELEIGPGPAGYLVLADTALPGWSVQVDGAPTPLARGNLFLRVVPLGVETGCRVKFTYTTPGLGTGLTLTTLSALVLIGLALLFAFSRRRQAMVEVS